MGEDALIRLSDILLLLCGIAIGMLLVCFRMALNLQRVYISPETRGKKANLIRIKDEQTGEEVVYVNPETFRQSLELFFTLAVWNFTGRKEDVLCSSTKRQNRLFITYMIIVVVAVVFSIYTIYQII
ncbi:hypothetical protein NX029_26390 [Cytobacillus firmus]|nr:hypothetical protein [Cytobacillus firmus]